MKKQLYILLASLFVALGTIGTVVPLLPTTPFLLLATYFYMRSSKQRLRALLRNKYLGPYIRSYFSKEGMPISVKLKTLTILWLSMLSVIIFLADSNKVRAILLVIAVGVTIHILIKKVKKRA